MPFENGAPPVGWANAAAYLVMPVLLVASQYASQKIISSQNNQVREGSRGQTGREGREARGDLRDVMLRVAYRLDTAGRV